MQVANRIESSRKGAPKWSIDHVVLHTTNEKVRVETSAEIKTVDYYNYQFPIYTIRY